MNTAVALRLFAEHATGETHRQWGKVSEQAEAAKKLLSIAFDRSFGYRVLDTLRNALVHTRERLITCEYSVWLDEPDSDDSAKRARVTLHLSRLAFAGSDARAATRKEVSALPEDPDILTLAGDALAEVEMLNSALEPYLYPGIDDAVALVWQTARAHFPTASHAPWFVKMDDEKMIGMLPVKPVFWDYIVRRASALGRQ